jgi:hypothetical protein
MTNGSLEMVAAGAAVPPPGVLDAVVVPEPPPHALASRPSARANVRGTRRTLIDEPPPVDVEDCGHYTPVDSWCEHPSTS